MSEFFPQMLALATQVAVLQDLRSKRNNRALELQAMIERCNNWQASEPEPIHN